MPWLKPIQYGYRNHGIQIFLITFQYMGWFFHPKTVQTNHVLTMAHILLRNGRANWILKSCSTYSVDMSKYAVLYIIHVLQNLYTFIWTPFMNIRTSSFDQYALRGLTSSFLTSSSSFPCFLLSLPGHWRAVCKWSDLNIHD